MFKANMTLPHGMCDLHFSNGVCITVGVKGQVTVMGFAHTVGISWVHLVRYLKWAHLSTAVAWRKKMSKHFGFSHIFVWY